MKNTNVIEKYYTDKNKTVYEKEDLLRNATDFSIEKLRNFDDANKNLDQVTKEIIWLKDKTNDFFILCVEKLENLYTSGKWREQFTNFEDYLKVKIGISYRSYKEKVDVKNLIEKYPELRTRADGIDFDHSKIRGLIPLMNNKEIPESEKKDIVKQASEFIITCTTREIDEKIKEIKTRFTGKTREDIEREKIVNAQNLSIPVIEKTEKMIQAENELFAKDNDLLITTTSFLSGLKKINLHDFIVKQISLASDGQKKQIEKNLLDIENMIRSFMDHLDYFKKINQEV